ncbi:MAG: hypothetical protein HZA19_01185 [Nitrospirae bacterium]|nr:hypothetical protein [Nitrospirota bacterium]
MFPRQLQYKVFLVVFLMLFTVALCGTDHGGMVLGEIAHDHSGQTQEDHGCNSAPFVRVATDDLSPNSTSLFFLLFSIVLIFALRKGDLSGFSSPFQFHLSESLIPSLSNNLYQRHAVYRI